MGNPYQSPRENGAETSHARPRRPWLNIWSFLVVWAFVCIAINRLAAPFYWNQPKWVQVVSWSPFLVGHASYIVAAIRYPTSVPMRIVRVVAGAFVFFAAAQIARMFFTWWFQREFGRF
jgi:hypothetical protein